ncbi:PA14 domain-containing protein, partial [Nibrella saemangeumensis]|uniref:PA14 domain-containing protein n=1 Tax=Nibrella saemangeumensis TaxID=1084526 RepID=UPI0031EF164D
MSRSLLILSAWLLCITTTLAQVTISRPLNRIVYQRSTGNTATIPISGQVDGTVTSISARLVSRQTGGQVGSTSLPISNGSFSGALTNVPGGWYELILETNRGTFRVDRVGVGEVFIIAGHSVAHGDQSYSIPYSNEDRASAVPMPPDNPLYQVISDPSQLLNTFAQYGNVVPSTNGVQPYFWSRFAEILTQRYNVPVAIYQTAYGGTNIDMWYKSSQNIYFDHYFVDASVQMPYRNLKNTLEKYVPQTGVRAVLVDHGQNDYPFTNVDEVTGWYNGFLNKARQELGFSLKAVINRHTPYLYTNPQHHIRQVQDRVAQSSNNLAGPDYDTGLTPSDRYDDVHLNSGGQTKAAQLWADVITESFLATVTPYQPAFQTNGNQAPVAAGSIPNQSAVPGGSFTYTIPFNTFTDPNSDQLTYQITNLPAGLSAKGLTISGTPTTGGTSTVTVRAIDPAGLSATVTFTITVATGGSGLTGNYYNNTSLSGTPVLSRLDPTINFFWNTDSPQPGVVNADEFSVRWTGQVEAPVSGSYSFRTNNDDGTRVWVNNQLIIDNWTPQGPTPKEGSI